MTNDITIGMDMGDKTHRTCVLNAKGEVTAKHSVANTAKSISKHFGKYKPCLIAIEAGTHSGWVSRLLDELGHKVLVGNPRKLRVIWDSDEKDDDRDAEMLARIARFDPHLLHPIHHRGKEAHADLAVIKARDMLVKARSRLVAHVRGSVKSAGERISTCSAACFHTRAIDEVPTELRDALTPVIRSIEELTVRIKHYNNLIKQLSEEKYPESQVVGAIPGVGPITSLAFILTLEESARFKKSRDVGPYLGLTPKRDKSGQTDKQLGITKAGNAHLRRLLVGCSQYILGPFGPDCDLRQFGLKLAERGGQNAKRRAVVAVARKLSVMMHHLWMKNSEYDPFYKENRKRQKVA